MPPHHIIILLKNRQTSCRLVCMFQVRLLDYMLCDHLHLISSVGMGMLLFVYAEDALLYLPSLAPRRNRAWLPRRVLLF
jgi:hypothetical protein